MVKITEKIARAEREDRTWWSFEFFPPRTAQGLANLYDRIERMAGYGPEFVDITWNAGGRTSDLTSQLVKTVHTYMGLETCMHLTCTNMPREKVDTALKEAKQFGCKNILALRGDPPQGQNEWEACAGGFTYAADLVRYIREQYGDYFAIAVAGFPEGHIEAHEGRDVELHYLKEKIEAGADFIFTQMFYDFDIFAQWVKDVRNAGITVPIVPGIMPIQTYGGFTRAIARFRTRVPAYFHETLDPVKEDDVQVRAVGTRLVADLCRRIVGTKELGIRGLHVYTMNLERGTKMLLDELQLVPPVENLSPLPWRPSLTPKRREESTRPIFWANRTKSYISRTETWDEFPNGRWGDARSPAFGDYQAYGVSLKYEKEAAIGLWGHPTRLSDVSSLFRDFCLGKVKALPWSDSPAAKETRVIDRQLAKMNELGYLTINSQPAVDGARSEDKVHGWGPKGGYVYQKSYLEFFVSPTQLDELIPRIEADSNVTYYAVNCQGDLRTNTKSEGPNAVTWGVFPGKEIVQPTIVEAISFMAWKDEAYELGRQWAAMYDADTPSHAFLTSLFDTFYLVNVVHNDFRDTNAIFTPFLHGHTVDLASPEKEEEGAAGKIANGLVGGVAAAAQGIKDVALNVGGGADVNKN